MPAHSPLTPRKRALVLQALGSGLTYEQAAESVGRTRHSLQNDRRADPGFDQACKAAREQGMEISDEEFLASLDRLSREGFRRVKERWLPNPQGVLQLVERTVEYVPLSHLILRRAERADPVRYGAPQTQTTDEGGDPNLVTAIVDALDRKD